MSAAGPASEAAPTVGGEEWFRNELIEKLMYSRGVGPAYASQVDWYQALGLTVRELLMARWMHTFEAHRASRAKFVCYLSAEYLLGRQLRNALLTVDAEQAAAAALTSLGQDLEQLRDLEIEPGLGNGGLGRLAACYLDSLAHLQIPAVGYGIRYEYGIFRQTFVDGRQVESPDKWLALGSPWEFPHPEMAVTVGFGGYVDDQAQPDGSVRRRWVPERTVLAVPNNLMIPGYGTTTVNTLRLWGAQATEAFNLEIFNAGDYTRAVKEKTASENISKVLYPDDSTPQGRELRLEQQFFFVSASLQDILQVVAHGADLTRLADRVALQLNDTHPAIAVAELMRLLMDVWGLSWEQAWDATRATCNYTCHTLMPEALEVWPEWLIGGLLPRHMEIIRSIDGWLADQVRERFPGDEDRVRRMSIILDGGVRMAFLATVGSARVNGVAELQSRLLRESTLRDFAELWPMRFTNVTNGVTPRRFVRLANAPLSELITEALGTSRWLDDLGLLSGLEDFAEDQAFGQRWRAVKDANKTALARLILDRTGTTVDPSGMFDVMVKRMHEYKRQLLKVMHIVDLHDRIRTDPGLPTVPRVVVFGAKAAPGYWLAKEIIRLINGVAATVNRDPLAEGRLSVVFMTNYNVQRAQQIIPAANLSEQISLAGKEASGTGNMKLTLNGALTIGTLDGANIEIRDLVGAENFFLFGLTEPEVEQVRQAGYHPRAYYEQNPRIRRVLDLLASGMYSGGDPDAYRPVLDVLLTTDTYLVLADYQSYLDCQDRVDRLWADQQAWTTMSIRNVARSGWFSSDRSVQEYLDRVWHASPVDVDAWRASNRQGAGPARR